MSSLLKFSLVFYFCSVLLASDEDPPTSTDDKKEELYDELLKILSERKLSNEKEEFRSGVNKIIDEEEDIRKIFECADIGQSCSIVQHCCGTYQCSGAFNAQCTKCVKQGQKCYRDSQCCPGYKCLNKYFFMGKCGVAKTSK